MRRPCFFSQVDPYHFGTFDRSLFVLFQVASGDAWASEITRDLVDESRAVQVCVCAYIRVRACIHACMHAFAGVHTCLRLCVHPIMFMCIPLAMGLLSLKKWCACLHACIRACVCVCVCAYVLFVGEALWVCACEAPGRELQRGPDSLLFCGHLPRHWRCFAQYSHRRPAGRELCVCVCVCVWLVVWLYVCVCVYGRACTTQGLALEVLSVWFTIDSVSLAAFGPNLT